MHRPVKYGAGFEVSDSIDSIPPAVYFGLTNTHPDPITLMLKHWTKLNTEILFQNPWWRYGRDTFEIPGGATGEYHYVQTNGSTMIIPVLPSGEIMLVRQYRYLCDRESLEFPAGSMKDGVSSEETAHDELAEETGFDARKMTEISHFNPYNGVTDEICRVYLAEELFPGPKRADDTEEFIVERHAPDQVDALIRANEIWDGMTLAAWIQVRPFVTRHKGAGMDSGK